ncbi:DUF6492 family protein [Bradyrhizobium prioriisuperbiae]|uniref:DUF6492 family protein n=1 Tax=Bradyrhizobium prioriisuperbiae TaxID=2854389 RepID=UPI0028F11B5A|nr:DUF6492 family protein [Bradyrhizobium prioritasuperba]
MTKPGLTTKPSLVAEQGLVSKRAPGTVSLITPSHRKDLERATLLIESIDRYVTSFERHYVIVHDEDLDIFKKFHGGRRVVLPVSQFLPPWLHQIPHLRWRGRSYWCSFRAKPVSGWHTQQLVKIKAAASLPEDRYFLIDSDNVFFRDFDVSTVATPNALPVHIYRDGVTTNHTLHVDWVHATHQLLGLEEPTFPTDDYIDQIIVWDKSTVNAMIARIEAVSSRDWDEALCRVRKISEYTIYGIFTMRDIATKPPFAITTDSFSLTEWGSTLLSKADILAMLDSTTHEVAICIQSYNPTSLATIRESLNEFHARNEQSPRRLEAV